MASARAMRRMQGDPLLAAAESAFGGGSDSSDESSDEGETPAPLNAFALLGGDDDDDESAEEKEEEPEPVKETTPPPASKKKKKKKQKQRQTPDDDGGDDEGEAVEDDGIDEITAALREIGEEMPTPRPDGDASSAADAASISGRDPLMCVDTRRLKAEDELRSIFGAKVIHAVETEEGNRGGLGLGGGQQGLAHIGRNPRGRKANQGAKLASTQTRSTLVQPKDSWPPLRAKHVGLAMECVGVEGHVKTFRFVRDTAGADADAAYQRAVASHDPNNLHALLQYWPWHVDALCALSDVYHYAGEGSKSAELLERALYAMEGAWHPWFVGCVADGTARMDARVVPAGAEGVAEGGADGGAEDASGLFFGTMFKHVQALTRRGCHRAALECSKLALSLDRTDPRGFLCCVDYFALRCGEEDWLLDFADSFRSDGSLLSHPSYAYSTALARLGGGRPGRRLRAHHDAAGALNGKGGKGGKGNRRVTDRAVRKGPERLSDAHRAEADDALLRALLMHPAAAVGALNRMESSAVSGDATWRGVLSHPHFAHARDECGSASLERLYDVFAERHHLLWRPDEALRWLGSACERAVRAVDGPDECTTIDGLTPTDFVAIRGETFPASAHNAYSHLAVEDFSDVVKRQLDEENPFMRRPNEPPDQMDFAAELGVDRHALMDAVAEMERELEAMGPDAMERARNMGPAEAARFLEAARAAANDRGGGEGGGEGERGRGNPLVEFFRTMFVQDPGDGGDGLARRIDRDVVDEAFNPG
ncbi:predicted protein [Micromonas commoda]|uniref:Transcription factor 25 n=1 Tax=Micromonas commoda (strain RCC299 / NOUM17 / CCMP2709) TaxID=296587 RepID=C1EHE8_MICCC|nr:predicted protein [Micromonas commoda]ACO67285.1 predicted protein [Micromonas commoda]|eukprot:XP_002506027.1 predicted protein [Micromonas commoda]